MVQNGCMGMEAVEADPHGGCHWQLVGRLGYG